MQIGFHKPLSSASQAIQDAAHRLAMDGLEGDCSQLSS